MFTMRTLLACGKFIHTERKKQKLSLRKLSERAFGNGNYATQIGKIEKSEVPQVTFDTIDKILSSLGYPMKDLFLNN